MTIPLKIRYTKLLTNTKLLKIHGCYMQRNQQLKNRVQVQIETNASVFKREREKTKKPPSHNHQNKD